MDQDYLGSVNHQSFCHLFDDFHSAVRTKTENVRFSQSLLKHSLRTVLKLFNNSMVTLDVCSEGLTTSTLRKRDG